MFNSFLSLAVSNDPRWNSNCSTGDFYWYLCKGQTINSFELKIYLKLPIADQFFKVLNKAHYDLYNNILFKTYFINK